MNAPTVHGEIRQRHGQRITPCCYEQISAVIADEFTANPDEVTCKPMRRETLAMQQWRLSVSWREFIQPFIDNWLPLLVAFILVEAAVVVGLTLAGVPH